MTDPTAHVRTAARRLTELVLLAAQRRPHVDYLAAIIEADQPDEVPLPRRVSRRIADALRTDVEWALTSPPPDSPYPDAYRLRRAVDAQARDRARLPLAHARPDAMVTI